MCSRNIPPFNDDHKSDYDYELEQEIHWGWLFAAVAGALFVFVWCLIRLGQFYDIF